MKVIIPAKASSERVVNKNWRPFDEDLCLVEVLIKKLRKAGFKYKDMFVSSESRRDLFELRQRYAINILTRSDSLCSNDTSLTKLIRSLTSKVDRFNEIAWAQCTCPTFDEYREVLLEWKANKRDRDSLAVAFPKSPYSLTPTRSGLGPSGWSFGDHHQSSQAIGATYSMPFVFSILTKQSIRETGYYVGKNPMWYISKKSHIDIDTIDDFHDAQAVYAARKIEAARSGLVAGKVQKD